MTSYGISPSEQEMLLELERERVTNNTNALARKGGFPSNPAIGDVYTSKTSVSIGVLTASGTSAAAIAGALVKKVSLPLAIVLPVAQAIALDYANDHNIKGFNFYVDYTYGPTNDGPLGWTPGYMSYETY